MSAGLVKSGAPLVLPLVDKHRTAVLVVYPPTHRQLQLRLVFLLVQRPRERVRLQTLVPLRRHFLRGNRVFLPRKRRRLIRARLIDEHIAEVALLLAVTEVRAMGCGVSITGIQVDFANFDASE